jgi:hypothetical protein
MSIEKEIKKLLESSQKSNLKEQVEDEIVEETVEDLESEELSDDQIVEDILALDEISKETLGRYIKKSKDDVKNRKDAADFHLTNYSTGHYGSGEMDQYRHHKKKISGRIKGALKATKRLTKEQKELIGSILEELSDDQIVEDILALDELSKKTLGNYINKAVGGMDGVAVHAFAAGDSGKDSADNRAKSFGKARKRIRGVTAATKRLTKEQKELIGSVLEELEQEENKIMVDVTEDVNALLNGEDLTEEFKTKAATIFEAAVVTRVKEEVSRLEEDYETRLDEQVESIKEELAEKVDGYLNYIVEKWIEDNEIALTNGIKLEMMEKFVSGIKNVFEENYIEVPEEKFDVLASMEEKLQELETKLDESLQKNVELHTEINSFNRKEIVTEACDGLTDTQVEKFKTLAEELSYEDEESFKGKLKTIRENYFSNKKSLTETKGTFITDDPIVEEVETVKLDPKMSAYVSALGK